MSVAPDVQKNHQARQQLVQQKSENEMVLEVPLNEMSLLGGHCRHTKTQRCLLQELKLLNDDANVFKLVGPALIKQDPLEAKANVNERIEFVSGELERLDNQLKSLETKSNEKQEEVLYPT